MDLRKRFLQNAAISLIASDPATSSHLSMQALQVPKPRKCSKRVEMPYNACRICGSILVRSWSCQRSTQRDSKGRHIMHAAGKFIRRQDDPIYECLRCHGNMKLPRRQQDRQPMVAKHHGVHSSPTPGISTTARATVVAKSVVESIQHRPTTAAAKTRQRKKVGLSALISQSRSNVKSASIGGLDLLDFMKTT